MKTKLYVPDIECDSCVKVIEKTLNKHQGIHEVKITDTAVDIEYDAKQINEKKIRSLIQAKGYKAYDQPYVRKTVTERFCEFVKDKKKYAVEYKMLKYIAYTFLFGIILEVIVIWTKQQTNPLFFARYTIWLIYLTIAVVSVAGVIWHYKSYKTTFTCMVGMMIGMTIGMQSGMMIGAIIGATSGFFWGALIGMLLASFVGVITGKCCGIMGVMEGVMAGIMGGTMGAMITVMMFAEPIQWFMPFYMILNLIALFGMVFMIFEESVEDVKPIVNKISFTRFASMTLAVLLLLTGIILVVPPSILMG